MSNVPAYPKNPALHPAPTPDEFIDKTAGEPPRLIDSSAPVQMADLDLSSARVRIKELVELGPIRIVLIAAGLGFFVGRACSK